MAMELIREQSKMIENMIAEREKLIAELRGLQSPKSPKGWQRL